MEFEKSNTRGIAIGGLTTGIIGTALASANSGLFGNILGGARNNACPEGIPVSRYEAAQAARIAELETEVKLRDANTYTLTQLNAVRDYVDGRFAVVERELADQRVYNATNIATVNCISGQVAQLMALTKLVVPNSSICPGWGAVTVTTTPAAATT